MQQYAVRAYDETGALHTFSRRMPSERELRVQLAKDNFVIGVIKRVEGDVQGVDPAYSEIKAKFIEQIAFFKQHSVQPDTAVQSLLTMFGKTPIKPMEHLKIFLSRISGGQRRSLRAALVEVINAIQSSATYAEALEKAPDIFSSDEITLLMISENRASQLQTFSSVSMQLHRDAAINNKINVALRYPKLLGAAVLVSVYIYFQMILPILRRFFHDQHEQLIFPLNVMIAIADFVSNPLYAALTVVVLALIAALFIIQLRTNPEMQYRFDLASMNMPLFGRIIRDKRLVRMFYSLKLMTENGREKEALDAAIGTARGPVFRDALKRAAQRFSSGSAGSGIAEALEDEDLLFDPVLIETLRIRQHKAALPQAYQALIAMLEDRIDLEITGLPKVIESMAGVMFAGMIGFMAYVYLVPSSYAVAHVH